MSAAGKASHSFDSDATWFRRQVSSRKRVLPTFAHAGRSITDRAEKELMKLVEDHATDKVYSEDGDLVSYAIDESYATRHSILRTAFNDFAIFSDSLPKMAIVSLVSLFDAYLARTLKNVYKIKPEILNGCTRQITFSELMSFGSVESARDHIIEKEIETLLRDSHVAQFQWLSKRLDVSLTELPSWKNFVEITERRNLLVHADGRVSKHYLSVCEENGIKLEPDISIGSSLRITPKYYKKACDCVAEIGLKLNQVLWRKLIPSEIREADISIIDISYDLLIQREYELCEQLLNLSLAKPFKKSDAEMANFMTINLAISLKGQKKLSEVESLLNKNDFSASADNFKLANYVLKDMHDEAAEIMLKMGLNDDVTEANYRDWPLFRWFRKTPEFKEAFKDVFGKEFLILKEVADLDSGSLGVPDSTCSHSEPATDHSIDEPLPWSEPDDESSEQTPQDGGDGTEYASDGFDDEDLALCGCPAELSKKTESSPCSEAETLAK